MRTHTASGTPTAYGYDCGYQDVDEWKGITTRLYREHGCYHIRQHDHRTGTRLAWERTTSLTEARDAYARLVAHIHDTAYGEWCADPTLCAGRGYCPRDPNCAD